MVSHQLGESGRAPRDADPSDSGLLKFRQSSREECLGNRRVLRATRRTRKRKGLSSAPDIRVLTEIAISTVVPPVDVSTEVVSVRLPGQGCDSFRARLRLLSC